MKIKFHHKYISTLGFKVVGTFLYGSQNYGLDTKDSDIDAKCIVLPSFENIVKNNTPVSQVIQDFAVRQNIKVKDQIDVKDIRVMFEQYRKQNISFLETLFSEHMYIEPQYEELFAPILENKEKIARYDVHTAIKAIVGMASQKYKAMEHPYSSLKEKIDKYGYDSKQLHHILRLEELLHSYINKVPFEKCLKPTTLKEYLMEVKDYKYNLSTARRVAEQSMKNIDKLKAIGLSSNSKSIYKTEVDEILDDVLMKIMKKNLMKEFKSC